MKRKPWTVLAALLLALSTSLPAAASSGSLNCGFGGSPFTQKSGDPTWRYHEVVPYTRIYTSSPSVTWPYSTGVHHWEVTPGTGSGACLA